MQNNNAKNLGLSTWKEATKLALLGLSRSPRPHITHPQLSEILNDQGNHSLKDNGKDNAKEYAKDKLERDEGYRSQITPEHQFLNFVSALNLYQEAGALPVSQETLTHLIHFDEAPPEKHSLVHQLKRDHLESLKHTPQLLLKYFTRLQQARVLVPPAAIPYLLELGIKLNYCFEPEEYDLFKASIKSLVAERGKWLIKQHPEWHKHYGLSLNEQQSEILDLWHHGQESERKSSLKLLRQIDPNLGRHCLMKDFKKEWAQLRQAFLAILIVNLSSADEPFLEHCLDDRSKTVQHIAASLLVCLPDSAYINRQTQNLSKYLSLDALSQFIHAGNSTDDELLSQSESLLKITLPKTKLDESETRDCLAFAHTKGGASIKGGQRINRLAELIRCVPLSWWTEQITNNLNLDRQVLIRENLSQYIKLMVNEAEKHDYGEALMHAWLQAYIHQSHIYAQQMTYAKHRLNKQDLNQELDERREAKLGEKGVSVLNQSSTLIQLTNDWPIQQQAWGQVLIDAFNKQSIEMSSLFYQALPIQLLKAELVSCLETQDPKWRSIILADQSDWSLNLSVLVMQVITFELSKVKKRKLPEHLYQAICHTGLHADLQVQTLIDQEWRAYQDHLPSELLDALDICQQRFVLRTEIQKQVQHLPLASSTYV